jgi:hypothetical protein
MKKSRKRPVRRVLYRSGVTPAEVDQLLAEIGLQQILAALDRLSGPDHTFVV